MTTSATNNTTNPSADETGTISLYAVIGAVLWTLLLSGLFVAYVVDNRQAIHEIGHSMAQASFEKDVLFRRWAARHGGVYVPETIDTPANPYLADVPERDITTPSGRRLTLVNPAYMTRQIFELAREKPETPQGHITSLNPIRPENAPDAWEAQALKALENGAKEVVESVQISGQPHLRLMRPLMTEKPCLRCHAGQGYKEGDGRGGISVTLSLGPIKKAMNDEMIQEACIHTLIWLVGLGLIWFGSSRIRRTTQILKNERNCLYESEQRFHTLADTAPVLIWMSDQTKGCTYFNKGWCDFTGRGHEELVGDGWTQDVHPDDLGDCIKTYENSFDARQPFSMEYRLRRHDGEYRWMVDNGAPRWENEAQFVGFVGSCIDITERKLSEVELRDSQEHYRAVVDAFDGHIYICSQDDIILFMNEKLIELFGRNAVGEPCFKALHELEAVCPWCVSERVFKGETVKREILNPKDDCWYYVINTPIRNSDGTISNQAMIQDITDRKQAEKELQKLTEELISQTRLQKGIIDFLPDATFVIDREHRVIAWNKAMTEMTGVTEEEILGKGDYAYSLPFYGDKRPLLIDMIGKDLEAVRQLYHNVEKRGKALSAERLVQPDRNVTKHHWFTASPLLDQDGSIIGAIESVRDVTEFKKAEEERELLKHQFHQAQKLESLGVLAGGIAHDFNNILTVIMGHCYMAREGMIQEQEYISAFRQIETAGTRATELCRQMLTYAGKSQAELTRVDLLLLVDEVVNMLQAAIKKNVTIELGLERDLPEITGDTGQIQQIIMNLVINAAEAIGDNNGTIKVALTPAVIGEDQTATDAFGNAMPAGRYICLEVADTGCGMDEETQKRIFEPFYTTKFAGRGLGMSAILGIIKAHDSILHLTSAPGAGTTFKIFFPVPETPDRAETAPAPSVPYEKGGSTILLVDDEEILRVMGEALLEAMGFTALTASNGNEALEIYRERGSGIDVILLDLIMPVMGGIEAYHKLREIAPAIPIIICSGYGEASVSDVIFEDEHAGFVHKPYKPDELRNMMMKMTGSQD